MNKKRVIFIMLLVLVLCAYQNNLKPKQVDFAGEFISQQSNKTKNKPIYYRRLFCRYSTDGEFVVCHPNLNIKLNGVKTRNGALVKAGSYQIEVKINGFHRFRQKIVIDEKNEDFILYVKLKTKKRTVKLQLRTFPSKQLTDPDLFMLNGIEASNRQFEPGLYQLTIEKKGYSSINKRITIVPADELFIINEILIRADK